MQRHERPASASQPSILSLPSMAMRSVLRQGYSTTALKRDVISGLLVGILAFPLSMAFAVASGVPPQYGIFASIVGGILAAAMGGSRFMVSGPTAALAAVLAPVMASHGLAGLLIVGAMSGVILVGMGLARLGKLISFIPHPVTTGFTTGIGVVIASMQVPDFFGLSVDISGLGFADRFLTCTSALDGINWQEFGVGASTLVFLVVFPRLTKRVPAPLVGLTLAGVAVAVLESTVGGFDVATIAERFTATLADGSVVRGIPSSPPIFEWPWLMNGARGLDLSWDLVRELLPSAFSVAVLGAIVTLMAGVVADGMTQTRHDPDAELIGQGVANLVTPFFGGIPVTGAIARTLTSIRLGAQSPISSIVHAVVILGGVLLISPFLSALPMASLAALLMVVAWNMLNFKHVVYMLRVAPMSDALVLLVCAALTIMFDMVVGVTTGVVLAALLFMRRMAEVTQAKVLDNRNGANHRDLEVPDGVLVYDIHGPLFFGAAQKAMAALDDRGEGTRVVIFDLDHVDAMDATGLIALESAVNQLRRSKVLAVIAGVRPQPLRLLQRARFGRDQDVAICASMAEAIAIANSHLTAKKASGRLRKTISGRLRKIT